jgi:hypothetical protein
MIRRIVVWALDRGVFYAINVFCIARWLYEAGVIQWVRRSRFGYLIVKVIAVIAVVLVLLEWPRGRASDSVHRCPVCDDVLLTNGRYCPECGSRL